MKWLLTSFFAQSGVAVITVLQNLEVLFKLKGQKAIKRQIIFLSYRNTKQYHLNRYRLKLVSE